MFLDLEAILTALGLVSTFIKPLPGADTEIVTASAQCVVTPYNVTVHPESFPPFDAEAALIYRYRQQQSVNLGSWFVQEQWMNPSLFLCAAGNQQAELDVASGWGGVEQARQVLERHWDEWIQEQDFGYLASIGMSLSERKLKAGINTVRLPIGYWSLGPEYCAETAFAPVAAVYEASWPRIVRAINWAAKHKLGVLVDLHGKTEAYLAELAGAPGSQNGQAHSGVSDGVQGLFGNVTNEKLTLAALLFLAEQLVSVTNVVGIQLLNEPSDVDQLPKFYDYALTALRRVSSEAQSFPFYLNDAYNLPRYTEFLGNRTDFVVLDHHSYFVFDQVSENTPAPVLAENLDVGNGAVSLEYIQSSLQTRRNMVIDEFSCALSGQALDTSSNVTRDRQRFCTGQIQSYSNATAGWSFWSYRTENCASDENWCFRQAVGTSLPSTFFSFPNHSTTTPTPLSSSVSDPISIPSSGPYTDDALWSEGQAPGTDWSQVNEQLAAANDLDSKSRTSLATERQRPFSAYQTTHIISSRHHPFAERHERWISRQSNPLLYNPVDVSEAKGYAEGLEVARIFATFDKSRLGEASEVAMLMTGFSEQFMQDIQGVLTKRDDDEQTTEAFKAWFLKGVAQGELEQMH